MEADIIEEFKNNICISCKSNCNEGVHIARINNTIILKCLEYKKEKGADSNIITVKSKINKEGV